MRWTRLEFYLIATLDKSMHISVCMPGSQCWRARTSAREVDGEAEEPVDPGDERVGAVRDGRVRQQRGVKAQDELQRHLCTIPVHITHTDVTPGGRGTSPMRLSARSAQERWALIGCAQ